MGTYKYRAKRGPKEIIEGVVEAQAEEEAIEQLSRAGYIPVKIELAAQADVSAISAPAPGETFKGRIASRAVTMFSRQLASLLRAGVPILKALGIILEQSEDPRLKSVLGGIYHAVKQGEQLSAALAQYPGVFSPLYVGAVRSGEGSGALPEALVRVAEYRAKQEAMLSRLRMALVYPGLMAVVGTGTVIFMLTFVMPRLRRIFSTLGQDLPLPTKILMAASGLMQKWWMLIVPGLIAAAFGLYQQARTKVGRKAWSALALHLPVFGNFVLKAEIGRFARTLELLIRNGIPILKALEIAVPVLTNDSIKEKLASSHKELEQGASFGRSLKYHKLFPPFMSNLISVGEESGRLEEALKEIADSYEADTAETLGMFNSLLEPAMILLMGLVIGFMVIAMLLPIFEINMMTR